MIGWQNPRRRHVKLKGAQLRVFLDLVDELVSQSSCARFAIDRNLARRLVVSSNLHVGCGQAVEKMQQDFHRVIMRINCRRQRFPLCFGRTHELGFRSVVRNAPVEPPYLKTQQAKIRQ